MEPSAVKHSENRAHAQGFGAGDARAANARARQVVSPSDHFAPCLVINSFYLEAFEHDAREDHIEHKIETRQL